MKVMILGSAGMFGHICSLYLRSLNKYEIIDIARNDRLYPVQYQIDIGIQDELIDLRDIIKYEYPNVIINCIGLLIKDSNDRPDKAIYINSFFPHWLEEITKNTETKVIFISSDCIFDGKKGNYTEKDIPTETNWYGRSKALGEIINSKDLTIRTSIIGKELKIGTGLLEWCLKQNQIKGWKNTWWNGETTRELAKFIDHILTITPITGLYQLHSPEKINRFDLLQLICKVFNRPDTVIIPIENDRVDKTIVNSRYEETHYDVPDYLTQLTELYNFLPDNEKRSN